MMQEIKYPPRSDWDRLLQRPGAGYDDIREAVSSILDAVRMNGDKTLLDLCRKYDCPTQEALTVADEEWASADTLVPALKTAIRLAESNIRRYHEANAATGKVVETMPGIRCWQRTLPIEKVGLYIPGGTAPLFSTLLMLGIPALLAGCEQIVVCSPPQPDGSLHPAILYTARLLGIRQVFKVGGAQAVAAMVYGTGTIPPVHKIFGPGNRYVTCAKLLLSAMGFAIDMPAGPSELAVLADESCNPDFVAADLLSQAEHGTDSQVLLVSDSETVIRKVQASIDQQLPLLPRREIAEAALSGSKAILVADREEGMALINVYAPEHLIIASDDAARLSEQVRHAGSVFLGHYAPESGGDYATGTNHALPTNGAARAFSGISVESFQKKTSFQQLTPEGLQGIGAAVIAMAEAEGLEAHARAVRIRSLSFNQTFPSIH